MRRYSRIFLERISPALRAQCADITREPLPARWVELTHRLDARERPPLAASRELVESARRNLRELERGLTYTQQQIERSQRLVADLESTIALTNVRKAGLRLKSS